MLDDSLIPRAFNSVFLLSHAFLKGLMFACHQHILKVADQESKGTKELHICSTTYSNFAYTRPCLGLSTQLRI